MPDQAVECEPLVVTTLAELEEVFYCLRCEVGVQLYHHVSVRGVQLDHALLLL